MKGGYIVHTFNEGRGLRLKLQFWHLVFIELRNESQAYSRSSAGLQGLTSLVFVFLSLAFGVMHKSVLSLSILIPCNPINIWG